MDTVVYENIAGTAGRFRWTRYLNIKVIEDTTNGYINATKMCAMYGKTKNGKEKQFRKWKYSNEHFIQLVSSSVLRAPDELIPDPVTGGQIEIICQLKQLVKFHRTTFQTSFTMDHIKEILLNLENTFHDEIRVL